MIHFDYVNIDYSQFKSLYILTIQFDLFLPYCICTQWHQPRETHGHKGLQCYVKNIGLRQPHCSRKRLFCTVYTVNVILSWFRLEQNPELLTYKLKTIFFSFQGTFCSSQSMTLLFPHYAEFNFCACAAEGLSQCTDYFKVARLMLTVLFLKSLLLEKLHVPFFKLFWNKTVQNER